ncbi:protein kinase, partial [Myxococcota bacterium]|nr:protein kinase [Myxococcota bacterium]
MTDFQPGPFGPFFLLHRVAVGSTAEVFAALDQRPDGTGDMVAVKRFPRGSPLAVETWNQEQRVHGLLRHGSVPRLLGAGEADGHPWLAQEWVQGKSLRQLQRKLTKSRHKLSMELGVHITLEVCKALDSLHRASEGRPLELVHCDISPGNVLLGYDGSVKLTDFGDVMRVGTALDPNVERPPGQLRYMSPEQALHEPLTQRSDLFSLGVVLHELLTGQLLFPDGVEPIIELRVRNTPVDAPSLSNPAVPKELDRAVVTALEPSHLKRHGSVRAFWMALDEIAEDVIARTGPEVLAKVMEIVFNREMDLEEQLLRAALSQAGIDLEPDERVLRVEPVTTLGERPPPEAPPAPRPPTHAPPVYSPPPVAPPPQAQPTFNPPPPTPTIAPPRLMTQPPAPSGRTDPGQRNDPRWSSPTRQRGGTAPGESVNRQPPAPPVFGVNSLGLSQQPSLSQPSLSQPSLSQPSLSQPALSPQRGPRAAAPPLSLVAAHTMYGGGGGGGSLSDDQLPTQFASIDLDDEDDIVEPDEAP